MAESSALPSMEVIESQVLAIRGRRVLLAPQLAVLYEVDAVRSQSVVSRSENAASRSQTVILKRGQNVKYAPYAFTEQGVAMLSSVLRSDRAIAVNIEIMRTFVKLRGMLAEHSDLKAKLTQLEKKYDANFRMVFDAIHQLMDEPVQGGYARRRIGFTKEK